jgi:hypothetical protein
MTNLRDAVAMYDASRILSQRAYRMLSPDEEPGGDEVQEAAELFIDAGHLRVRAEREVRSALRAVALSFASTSLEPVRAERAVSAAAP